MIQQSTLLFIHDVVVSFIFFYFLMTFVRPKRTWREVVENDCQVCKLNTEDAVDRSRWRKLIKDV